MIQNLQTVLKTLAYLLVIHSIVTADDQQFYNDLSPESDWQGQWFPNPPGSQDPNPVTKIRESIYDPNHGISMGIKDPNCDDAKTNLEIDWDFNPINYTCFDFNEKYAYRPRSDIRPVYTQDHIPKGYSAHHKCMNKPIEYEDLVPTFGTHRPLWAKYGEYTFLPKQRWIHNLEHGAVVMLYHPCADKNEVNVLRRLVNRCLYRHIITPYNLLSTEHPLVLVTWGHRLEMSKVAPEIVVDFIKKHALRGPEQTARDGQYDFLLERHASIVSDIYDHEVCKIYDYIQ